LGDQLFVEAVIQSSQSAVASGESRNGEHRYIVKEFALDGQGVGLQPAAAGSSVRGKNRKT
jgi:hypothetical protein